MAANKIWLITHYWVNSDLSYNIYSFKSKNLVYVYKLFQKCTPTHISLKDCSDFIKMYINEIIGKIFRITLMNFAFTCIHSYTEQKKHDLVVKYKFQWENQSYQIKKNKIKN